MDFPYGETVTILSTATTTDDYGNQSTVVTEVAWGPCAVAPRSSSESVDSHAPAVIVGLSIYGPAGVTINADDKVRIDGVLYDVDGQAGDWTSPFTGWHPGIEVAVKRAGSV